MTEPQTATRRKLISICVPVYNEEDNIRPFYARLRSVIDPLADRYDFEIVVTDNHSEDRTFEELIAIGEIDNRLRVIRFSRNFGFQRSILSNYQNCRGDAAIQLDVDLQDPPEIVPEFLRLWEEGYKVVYGVRRARPNENWLLQATRKLFYRLIDFLSEDSLPHDAGDFRLIDRCIIQELRSVSDQKPYLRGMIAAMGFRQTGIVYDRAERQRGVSKFNLARLVGLALDGILNHSVIPLRIATILGVVMSAVASIVALFFVFDRLFFSTSWPAGFAGVYLLVLFSIGMNALLLGIIGEYIGSIYKNVKRQPLIIVEAAIDHGSAPLSRDEYERGGDMSLPTRASSDVEQSGKSSTGSEVT